MKYSLLADFVLMKHVAERHGVTENVVLRAIDELPDAVLFIGRARVWHVSQLSEIDAVMQRRRERRNNRTSESDQNDVA